MGKAWVSLHSALPSTMAPAGVIYCDLILEESWAIGAIAASPINDRPTIWIRTRSTQNGQAVIEIADNGPGIPE